MQFALTESSAAAAEPGAVPVEPAITPVCRLDSGNAVAIEVQLRGVGDPGLATSHDLRSAARAAGAQQPLDRSTWVAARSITGYGSCPVLVMVDLDSLTEMPEDAAVPIEKRRMIVLLGDDSVAADPATTLRSVRELRRKGHLIALDQVGRRPRALAMLPLVEPDVILLAPEILQRSADAETARVVHAINAQVERTLAVVVAVGVDTESARRRALAMGAEYGQGAVFADADTSGVEGDWPTESLAPATRAQRPGVDGGRTPFALASARRKPIQTRKRLLVTMSRLLEAQAATSGPEVIALATFQRAEHFTPASRVLWESIAERAAYTAVYGVGLDPNVDAAGIHCAPLDTADRLVHEWNVVVVAPHFAAVLSARDLHRGTPDAEREFEYVLSYDRRTAIRSAHAVLDRFGTTL